MATEVNLDFGVALRFHRPKAHRERTFLLVHRGPINEEFALKLVNFVEPKPNGLGGEARDSVQELIGPELKSPHFFARI